MLGGVGGWSERTKTSAMINVIAVGINQIMFMVEISSELVTINGVTDKPRVLPRTMASVMPPLAIADSPIGNQSLVTCGALFFNSCIWTAAGLYVLPCLGCRMLEHFLEPQDTDHIMSSNIEHFCQNFGPVLEM